ncbi:hypothetical protein TNCT_79831 [Trichonephila clavata]|uniref:Uncharacterized protein n=1 Tax=Trichonephila clavata TaxID=2740835 RepID=A0A8X6LEX4_TRICU|nr:hypothetical protein TNCT_79831 [Trichonephila clavata]
MSNMRIMILSVFLLILLIVSSVHGVDEKKVFCDESITKEMQALDKKTPPKFKEAHLKCLESRKKEDFKDIEVQCEKEGDNTLSETTRRGCFRRLENNELEEKEPCGASKEFEGNELEKLLAQNPCQKLAELEKPLQVDGSTVLKLLKALGVTQKQGYWAKVRKASNGRKRKENTVR